MGALQQFRCDAVDPEPDQGQQTQQWANEDRGGPAECPGLQGCGAEVHGGRPATPIERIHGTKGTGYLK
ncbi:circadian clock protein kinase KaiC [Mycolicibacterium fortuitum subsp. acetamidolyticum]|uniref:Circadian clock protein kinase KaiC n=1 Tax=Mycolicibacterium fortuitum subsp. acetamidolyticum TaxID=144550 RepID=A0A100WLI6_MYCFO|nr:hypothetical protein MFTT_49310 [Mycolicibacterium fortuitum subsp. fortuitum]BDE00919.1 hypothetical protein MFTT_50120 [Mycolicibacterium fortuitum subsp. fortuitum]GAT00421.1 circadian clock protein kinase KaiC [Mycolicibacterium fortuitum subsp. acetamidolyticum]